MQMTKGPVGELAYGMLGDNREPDVAELGEQNHQHAPDPVGDDQHRRQHGEAKHGRAASRATGAALASQLVHDLLVGDRDEKGDRLGDDQRTEGVDHAPAEIGPVGRPDVRKQLLKHGELTRPRLKHGVAPSLRQVLHEEVVSLGRMPDGKKGSANAALDAYSPHASPRQARQGGGIFTFCAGRIRFGFLMVSRLPWNIEV